MSVIGPVKQTPAHRTDQLAEIVCSNSLKSDEPGTASYLLKEELRRADSLVMEVAAATRVPAGAALAVDRQQFAELITKQLEEHPRIEVIREEVTTVPEDSISIVATGPLTSEALTLDVMKLTGKLVRAYPPFFWRKPAMGTSRIANSPGGVGPQAAGGEWAGGA